MKITAVKGIDVKGTNTFRSERHQDFTEKISKISLSSNDDKRMP